MQKWPVIKVHRTLFVAPDMYVQYDKKHLFEKEKTLSSNR